MHQLLSPHSLNELREIWLQEFKQPAPPRARKEFLIGHLQWQAQARAHGGLSRKTKGRLKRLMQQLRDGANLTPTHELIIKPGTKLLREYQGIKHEVIVTDDGYRYKDTIYRSLSKIAREITGTQWNGKLFFGVKK